ncbi:hypothetical protein LEMLEM_LOCUS2606, partial [Lemmus lemmus]
MTIALSGNESLQQLSIKNIFHHNWIVTCIWSVTLRKDLIKNTQRVGF